MKTVEEVAEKVIPDVLLENLPKGWIVSLRHNVTQACDEAYQNGVADAIKKVTLEYEQGFSEGFSDAKEKAANVCDEFNEGQSSTAKDLAKEIRTLQPDLEGK